MTYKELVKAITELEGKKSQVSIGNVKEVMKAVKLLSKADPEFLASLMKYLTK